MVHSGCSWLLFDMSLLHWQTRSSRVFSATSCQAAKHNLVLLGGTGLAFGIVPSSVDIARHIPRHCPLRPLRLQCLHRRPCWLPPSSEIERASLKALQLHFGGLFLELPSMALLSWDVVHCVWTLLPWKSWLARTKQTCCSMVVTS